MQSLLTLRANAWLVIFPCLFAVAGCGGGGEKDAMQKRLASMSEELTRLTNANDRLAERVQSLEIQTMNARSTKTAEPARQEEPPLLRPQLKVVKVGPGVTAETADEPRASEPAAPYEEESKDRPVLREYGHPAAAAPAWAKPRANPAGLGQNRAGAVVPKNPQGT